MADLSPLWLSLQVAGTATMLVIPVGVVLSWWLSHGRPFRGKIVIEALATLPLVLPPTVVGFYLLLILGRGTALGRWVNNGLGLHLLFTWEGAATAASVMALPLFVRAATSAFASVEHELLEVGRTLGASEARLLVSVIVPISYRGLLAALSLSFARALGEFGATLMVAGSIPGRTQTMPLALYAAVQDGADHRALVYTGILSAAAFLIVWSVGLYQSGVSRGRGER